MLSNILRSILLLLIFGSCKTPYTPLYVPELENLDVNKYGSYVEIEYNIESKLNGELISIDSNLLIVLEEKTNICQVVYTTEIKQFTLRYAKHEDYVWSVPLYTLMSLSHGYFLILTTPINLLTVMIVILQAQNAYIYTNKDMTYEKLKMFARFPQGIPPNIEISDIKRSPIK